jgi:hypothetical protein
MNADALVAAGRRGPEELKELVRDVSARDEGGQTALHVICADAECPPECVALLIKMGADVKVSFLLFFFFSLFFFLFWF